MPSPSKNKGNSWERDVAKELSKLYSETFIRAPGSGAYTGGFNSHRKEYLHEGQIRSFKGDIIPGQSFPKMNAECKSYGEFPFHQLLQGESKQLETWLDQLMVAADDGDFSILIVKITRKIKFVAIQKHGPPFSFEGMPSMIYESSKYGSWIICEYDRFWATNAAAVKAMCGAQVTAS
jgi:hypothetical protein